MGDRYILEIVCSNCNTKDDDVYFAPTCGFTEWKCKKCGNTVDLYKYTGISYEDASNIDLMKEISNKQK